MATKLIRFDWAMKRMLRHKANFDILEGFLSELLGEAILIKQLLDSESNKQTETDKFNRVDILVENSKGELVIIEVQNSREFDYFQRILYGTSKVITEHIKEGDPYGDLKKVISVTIAYFDLGQGKDYLYRGRTVFEGVYENDILALSLAQVEKFGKQQIHDLYPEYWLIKADQFNDEVKNKLDEWIYFLKNAEIKSDFSAKGLKAAADRLDKMKLNEQEAKAYNRYLNTLHDIASENFNKQMELEIAVKAAQAEGRAKGEAEGRAKGEAEGRAKGEAEGRAKGEAEGRAKGEAEGRAEQLRELILEMHKEGLNIQQIARMTKQTTDFITQIIEKQKEV